MKFLKAFLLIFMTLIIMWGVGFGVFSLRVTSMQPHDIETPSGAIIVLTGGDGRINTGLDLFAARRGLYLYITSVHPKINETSIREKWEGKSPLPVCCIELDYKAESTVQNAQQTRAWITYIFETTGQQISSARLVTSDYHMPRALLDFKRIIPDLTLYPHPTSSKHMRADNDVFWRLVLQEYHKYLYRSVQGFALQVWRKVYS